MDSVKVTDVINALRERILTGEFGTGGRLPSHRVFAEQYGTSRETVNKALRRLEAEGLIVSYGLQGLYVSPRRVRIPGHLSRFAFYLQQLGLEAVDAVVGMPEVMPASKDVAQFLKVPEGTSIVRVLRRQGTIKVHYRIIEAFFPLSLVDGAILEQLQLDGGFDALSAIEQVYGKAVRHVREDIIGRFPTEEEQELLGIVRGTPVLEVNSAYYADGDAPVVMYTRSVLVASYFVLSYDIPSQVRQE